MDLLLLGFRFPLSGGGDMAKVETASQKSSPENDGPLTDLEKWDLMIESLPD